MGEEVKDPSRTIPKAILAALTLALIVYALIAVTVLLVIGPARLASSAAPLVDVVTSSSWARAAPLVRIGAAAAALGALLALVARIGRTTLAMARNRDLPTWLSAIHPVYNVPHHAEIALAVVVSVLVLAVDLRGAIGFSSFGVLLYHFIANVAAFTQDRQRRGYPKVIQVVGAVGCVIFVATLPPTSIVSGIAVLLIGRLLVLRRRKARSPAIRPNEGNE